MIFDEVAVENESSEGNSAQPVIGSCTKSELVNVQRSLAPKYSRSPHDLRLKHLLSHMNVNQRAAGAGNYVSYLHTRLQS